MNEWISLDTARHEITILYDQSNFNGAMLFIILYRRLLAVSWTAERVCSSSFISVYRWSAAYLSLSLYIYLPLLVLWLIFFPLSFSPFRLFHSHVIFFSFRPCLFFFSVHSFLILFPLLSPSPSVYLALVFLFSVSFSIIPFHLFRASSLLELWNPDRRQRFKVTEKNLSSLARCFPFHEGFSEDKKSKKIK